MFVGADYPFLDLLWTMLIIFAWVIWFWMLISIMADVFRRRDIGGVRKAIWIVFLILLPFVGVLSYLVVNSDDIARRNAEAAKQAQADVDSYIKSVAGGGAASEIERAKALLDSGAISQAEYEGLKAKALGA